MLRQGDPTDEGVWMIKRDYKGRLFDNEHKSYGQFLSHLGGMLEYKKWLLKQWTNVTPSPKRNDPCICGSEKKYKNCCGL